MKHSWKTTLIGSIAGSIPIIHQTVNLLSAGQHVDWYQVGFGIGVIIFGIVSKDWDMTGGDKSQPTVSNPPTLIEQK